MELLKKITSNETRTKRKKVKSKPFNERRILTRKIIRNKLKFEFKKMGYKHVNRNFKSIIKQYDGEQLEKLINA